MVTLKNFIFFRYVAKLKCHLDDRGDPYYFLHPHMVEVAHFDPEILVFHNIVSSREMTVIRELAAPLLLRLIQIRLNLDNLIFDFFSYLFHCCQICLSIPLRSQVQGKQQGSSEVSLTRTSKTGWLQVKSTITSILYLVCSYKVALYWFSHRQQNVFTNFQNLVTHCPTLLVTL